MREEQLAGSSRAAVAYPVGEAASAAGIERQVAAGGRGEDGVGKAHGGTAGVTGAEGARQGDPGVVVEVGIDVAHSQSQAAAEQRKEVVGAFDVGLGHVEVAMRMGHEGRPGIGGKSGTRDPSRIDRRPCSRAR